MTVVLTLDPSVRSPGIAIFHDSILCETVRMPVAIVKDEQRGARVARAADTLMFFTRAWRRPDVIVYEWPQVYRAGRSKGDPADLIALAAVGAALAAILAVPTIVTPTASEWTGGLPKVTTGDPWKSPRGRRIASRLSPAELALVPKSHDAIDAVGLGLWYLGRFAPARVFPGAT